MYVLTSFDLIIWDHVKSIIYTVLKTFYRLTSDVDWNQIENRWQNSWNFALFKWKIGLKLGSVSALLIVVVYYTVYYTCILEWAFVVNIWKKLYYIKNAIERLNSELNYINSLIWIMRNLSKYPYYERTSRWITQYNVISTNLVVCKCVKQ